MMLPVSDPESCASSITLQRWLMTLGVGGKDEVKLAITQGRVTVDGVMVRRFAELVSPDSDVALDGLTLLPNVPEPVVVVLYKPIKHVTALADQGPIPGLAKYVPPGLPRVFPVGRLDVNTEGLLVLTNDGRLARRLLHPSYAVPRTYHVKLRGHLTDDDAGLARIRLGMTLDGETLLPPTVRVLELRTRATWVELVLTEGKYREIRRMCVAVGHQIVKLRRIAFGPLGLGTLTPRVARRLDPEELPALYAAVGLDAP